MASSDAIRRASSVSSSTVVSSGRCAQRTRRGRARPCTTSDSTTTIAVTHTTRSRPGCGLPSDSATGTESATAREMAPRKPATVDTMRPRAVVRIVRCSGRRSRSLMIPIAVVMNTSRATSVVAHTATAMSTARTRVVADSSPIASGSSSPMRTNSAPLRRNVESVKNGVDRLRERADTDFGATCDM